MGSRTTCSLSPGPAASQLLGRLRIATAELSSQVSPSCCHARLGQEMQVEAIA